MIRSFHVTRQSRNYVVITGAGLSIASVASLTDALEGAHSIDADGPRTVTTDAWRVRTLVDICDTHAKRSLIDVIHIHDCCVLALKH